MQDAEKKKKEKLIQALGKVVSTLRKESKRSARSVSYEINMSKTTLLLAESGKLDPQLSTFCKIAEAFYVKPEKLLEMVYAELPPEWSIIDDSTDL